MVVLRWLLLIVFAASSATAWAEAPSEGQAQKRIALTFDDTPRHPGAFLSEDERTERLIAALKQAGVEQAAFFINPGKISERPGAKKRIAAYVSAGHVLANHTGDHPKLRDTPSDDYIANIDAAEEWLRDHEAYRPWFRFPYLDEGGSDKAKRDAIRDALAERGLSNGYVTVDASDWFYDQAASDAVRGGKTLDLDALKQLFVESHVEAAETYDGIAREALGRSPAHVMLLHEADVTVLFLGDLITKLKAEGWTIISADEAYADPISDEMPDVPYSQGTLVEMIAWERGMPAPRWYDRNDVALAGRLFNERVLGILESEPSQ